MNKTAVFFGSFDPVTHGHLWIVNRILTDKLADNVLVCLKKNRLKTRFLSLENAHALFALALPPALRSRVSFHMTRTFTLSAPPHASFLVRGVRDETETVHETYIKFLTCAEAAVRSITKPLPMLWIASNPPTGATASTAARNVLFSPAPRKEDLVKSIPEKAADILLAARKQIAPHKDFRASIALFNQAVAARLPSFR